MKNKEAAEQKLAQAMLASELVDKKIEVEKRMQHEMVELMKQKRKAKQIIKQ